MIGAHVIFTDEHRAQHNALVTFEHNGGNVDEYPLGKVTINLLYVADDESQTDQYGRQIIRKGSVPAKVVHESIKMAGGYFYELPDYVPPE